MGRIIITIIGGFFIWALAYEFVEISLKDQPKPNRAWCYSLAVVFLFVFSVVGGCIVAAPISAGDVEESTHKVALADQPGMPAAQRDALIEQIFTWMLFPALLGVRCALGPKSKPVTGGDL